MYNAYIVNDSNCQDNLIGKLHVICERCSRQTDLKYLQISREPCSQYYRNSYQTGLFITLFPGSYQLGGN
jgi:hypothetical protein